MDGSQHRNNKEDKIRDRWLKEQGFEILRFWDNEVLKNIDGVLEIIREKLVSPYPNPLPQGERGEEGKIK